MLRNRVLISFACFLGLSAASLLWSTLSSDSHFKISDSKWSWIDHRIHAEERQELDAVFVGSSLTWCAVSPKKISESGSLARVWNFGRNWRGRDADYIIARKLLRRHKVHNLFVEVSLMGESNYHPYAKYLFTPKEYVEDLAVRSRISDDLNLLRNRWVFKPTIGFYLTGFGALVAHAPIRAVQRQFSTGCASEKCLSIDERNGEFLPTLNEIRSNFNASATAQPTAFKVAKPMPRIHPMAEHYLSKLQAVAREHETQLWLVFYPFQDGRVIHPTDIEKYSEFGEVVLLQDDELLKPSQWRDPHHFSREGAALFSQRLSEEVERRRGGSFYAKSTLDLAY